MINRKPPLSLVPESDPSPKRKLNQTEASIRFLSYLVSLLAIKGGSGGARALVDSSKCVRIAVHEAKKLLVMDGMSWQEVNDLIVPAIKELKEVSSSFRNI